MDKRFEVCTFCHCNVVDRLGQHPCRTIEQARQCPEYKEPEPEPENWAG